MGSDRPAKAHPDAQGQRSIGQSPTELGDAAEDIAARYLRRKGFVILERNFRCRLGELDIIASTEPPAEPTLVFVEVRLRNHLQYGTGADSVTQRKQRRLTRAARYYLLKQGTLDRNGCLPLCRFDVISVRQPNYTINAKWHIEWIQNAFEAI